MRISLLVILTLLYSVLITGCNEAVVDSDPSADGIVRALDDTEKALSEAGNEFSYQIFHELTREGEDENIFISPLSISIAFAMLLNGAEGETFDEIRQTLELRGHDLQAINENYHSLIRYLREVDQSVEFAIANSVWHDERFSVSDTFLTRLDKYYNASAEGLDFRDRASVGRINDWVSKSTNGLIDSILDEIPEEMVLYLINALYFKGEWLYQFDEKNTAEGDFFTEGGNRTRVELMRAESSYATYFSEEVQMIEVPYGDSLFTMTIIMPADMDQPLDPFISEKLTAENLDYWTENLWSGNIQLKMPKFSMEYEKTLNEVMQRLGVERVFQEGVAELGGLSANGLNNLFVSEVKHKTFLEVNEEGSEAAAVTSIGVQLTSVTPSVPKFTVNRPFAFLIRERASGSILFMGKMKNPSL